MSTVASVLPESTTMIFIRPGDTGQAILDPLGFILCDDDRGHRSAGVRRAGRLGLHAVSA